MKTELAIPIFIAVNIILALLTNYYIKIQLKDRMTIVWKWYAITMAFFLPIIGSLGVIIHYKLLKRRRLLDASKYTIDYNEHMGLSDNKNKDEQEGQNETSWGNVKDIVPLVDVFNIDDVEYQKAAIETLVADRELKSIKLLKDTLKYAKPEVRYFIVDALTSISKQYSDDISAAKLALNKNPDSVIEILTLAECFYNYAVSGIEDESLSAYYLNEAGTYYEEALSRQCDEVDVSPYLSNYADVLKRLNKPTEALHVLNNLIAKGCTNSKAIENLLDIYFQQGKNDELKELLISMESNGQVIPEQVKNTLVSWV